MKLTGITSMKILNRIFGTAEEINGAERCSTYLFRWTLLETRVGKIYLHKFVGDDWSRDVHDHPKRFWSIGLWGSYREFVRHGPDNYSMRDYRAPWIRTFPATHAHRLTLRARVCWTLVIIGNPTRDWGFWHDEKWIQWESYVRGADSQIADRMKDC